MKNSIYLVLAVLAISAASCKKDKWPYCIKANGDIVEETRVLESFDEVDFNLSGNLYITFDPNIDAPEIRIRTSKNVMDRIETKVKGSTLKITDDKCIRKLKDFDAYLTVNQLSEVSLNGSGDIKGQNAFKVDNLRLHINGSGNIELEAYTTNAELDINGSGNIHMDGTTDNLEASINGSGNIEAFGFDATEAYVNISGSGTCEVSVIEALEVNISGSGDVIYDGSPTVNLSSSGSGSVRSR